MRMLTFILFLFVFCVLAETIIATSITGCVETANEFQCQNTTFTGNTLDAGAKNIYILDAVIAGQGTDGSGTGSGTDGSIQLTSTGTIKIVDSTLNGYGGKQGVPTTSPNGQMCNCWTSPCSASAGDGEIIITARNIDFQNIVFDADGGQGWGFSGQVSCSGTPRTATMNGADGSSHLYINAESILNFSKATGSNIVITATGGFGLSGHLTGANADFKLTAYNISYYDLTNSYKGNLQSNLLDFTLNQAGSDSANTGTTQYCTHLLSVSNGHLVMDNFDYSCSMGTKSASVYSENVFALRNASSFSTTGTLYINGTAQPNYGYGISSDSTASITISKTNSTANMMCISSVSECYSPLLTDYQFWRAVNSSVPSISAVDYSPASPTAGQNVSCVPTYSGSSGSTLVPHYIWWHNQTKYPSQGALFNGSLTGNQDTLQCQTIVTDGILNSTAMNGTQISLNDLFPPKIVSHNINVSTTVWYNSTVLYTVNCTDNQTGINSVLGTINGANQTFSFSSGTSVLATLNYIPTAPNVYNLTHIFCKDGTLRGSTNTTTLMNFTALMPPAPLIHNYSISLTTAIYNTNFTVNFTCEDVNAEVTTVTGIVTRPSGATDNLVFSFARGITATPNANYLADAIGTYNITSLTCWNSLGNFTTNSTTLSFIATSTPTSTQAGGGGGGGIAPKRKCNLQYAIGEIFNKEKVVLFDSQNRLARLLIINNDVKSIAPTYTLQSQNFELKGFTTAVLLPNQTTEVSIISKLLEIETEVNSNLIIGNVECYDVIIPLKIVKNIGDETQSLFFVGETFKDTIIGTTNNIISFLKESQRVGNTTIPNYLFLLGIYSFVYLGLFLFSTPSKVGGKGLPTKVIGGFLLGSFIVFIFKTILTIIGG